ncbi:MAG: hypothetical protein ILO53_02225 [Clostridia bacterium]|nr:hypothetical protein [Clostridia bacterium]
MKRIAALLLSLVIILGTGCARDGGADTGQTGKPSGPETGDYTIEEKGGRMIFTSAAAGRFSYAATGFEELKDNMFAVSGILAMEGFSGEEFKSGGAAKSGSFNYYTLKFRSNGPFKGTVTYRDGAGIVSEEFFLETDGGEFSSFIEGAFGGKTARELVKIELKPLRNDRNRIVVTGFVPAEKTEVSLPDENDIVFIENGRFRFGAGVNWGGAAVWFEDKNNPVEGVVNLINRHDTGRLVQQSYYGTGAIDGVYDPGEFLGTKWMYNPVQGGDKGNTPSKIVDLRVTEDTVYVKSQPMDWGQVGQMLPCYMENTYRLFEDRVEVDNRFVDFSGFTHPYQLQELPAFYTVSYLDALVLYSGREPWTGGELTVLDRLTNWADPGNTGQNVFYVTKGNTETWTAWVNLNDDYGVGLYTPNYDEFSAGRYQYDGSKSDTADPTNYVAPRRSVKVTCFEPLSYSYMITAGTVSEMRECFTRHKDFTFNVDLTLKAKPQEGSDDLFDFTDLDFTKAGTELVFTGFNNTEVSFDEKEGAALLAVTNPDDVGVSLSLVDNADREMLAKDFDVIEIECMVPRENSMSSYTLELFLATGGNTAAMPGLSVTATLTNDGRYHKILLPVGGKEFWSGTVNRLRLDYFTDCEGGDRFYVKSFGLKNSSLAGSAADVDLALPEGLYKVAGSRDTVISYDSDTGATMLLVTDGSDVNISFDYLSDKETLKGEDYRNVVVEYMIPASNKRRSYDFEMYLRIGGVDEYTEDNSARGRYVCDGEFHTLTVPLSTFRTAQGTMLSLRFDYFSKAAEGDVMYLKSVRLE